MSLREDLKNYVPVYLWERIEHPEGHVVSNEEYNARWNLLQTQGDQQANAIKDVLKMLYETVLDDSDGTSHIKADLPEYAADNLKHILELIDTRLKSGVQSLTNHKNSDDHDDRYYTKDKLDSGQLNHLYFTKGQLNPFLAGGNVPVYTDKFTIVNSDNEDGTFTYHYKGEDVIGQIVNDAQVFTIADNTYVAGSDSLLVYINGINAKNIEGVEITELSDTTFSIKPIQENNVTITAKYVNQTGIIAVNNVIEQLSDLEEDVSNLEEDVSNLEENVSNLEINTTNMIDTVEQNVSDLITNGAYIKGNDGNTYEAVIGEYFFGKITESVNYGDIIFSIAIDDNYVYVGGDTTNKIWKLNKSDLTKVAESERYGNGIRTIAIDDNYVYVGNSATNKIWKLNKSDLTKVAESEHYGSSIRTIAIDDNYVYVGGSTNNVWKLLYMNKLLGLRRVN